MQLCPSLLHRHPLTVDRGCPRPGAADSNLGRVCKVAWGEGVRQRTSVRPSPPPPKKKNLRKGVHLHSRVHSKIINEAEYLFHTRLHHLPKNRCAVGQIMPRSLLSPDFQTRQMSRKHFKKQRSLRNDPKFSQYLLKYPDEKEILSVEVRSELNRLHQSSTGELANRDQEISFDRSNILGL